MILEIAAGIVLAVLILTFIRPILILLFWAAVVVSLILLGSLARPAFSMEVASTVQPVIQPTAQTAFLKEELPTLCEELGGVQVATVLVGRNSSGQIISIEEMEIHCEKRDAK